MIRELVKFLISSTLACSTAYAAPRVDKPTAGKSTRVQQPPRMMKGKPAQTSRGGTPLTNINMPLKNKQPNLTGEKRYRSTQSNVSFDAAVIEGEAVRPVVSSVSGQKSDQEFDLIPLRKRWHSEMIDSSIEY